MSYFRGDNYIWASAGPNEQDEKDLTLHIWQTRPMRPGCSNPDYPTQIALDRETFDQLAVMRCAQLVEEGRIHEVIARAKKSGNGGAIALQQGWLFGKRNKGTA